MSPRLPVPWQALWTPQLHDGYCLPACLQIALSALGIPITQQRLAQLLDTNDAGTPFSRVTRLKNLGVLVEYKTGGTLDLLNAALAADAIGIAAVHAGWLPYAQVESQHVVIVVALSPAMVTVLDPAATHDLIDVPIDAWLAAWIEMDCAYTLLKR